MAQQQMQNMLSSWDWANKHVQPRDSVSESRFINGATVLISAGPPRLSGPGDETGGFTQVMNNSSTSNLVFPIGVCLDASIQQSRQLQRIYEIGSDRSYFVQGRHVGMVALNRILFNGANLLRVLYAYYPAIGAKSRIKATRGLAHQAVVYDDKTTGAPGMQDEKYLDSVASTVSGSEADILRFSGERELPEIQMNPGYNNVYLNLASDLFQQPLGLMFLFQDIHKRTMSACYLEMCFVQSHSISVQGQTGTLVAETVQMQFDRIAPINIV